MNEEEFFNRIINKIAKDYGYDVASTLELMFFKKEKQLEAYENMRKEAIEKAKDIRQFVYDELVDRYVCGATETHCKIQDLLNILNKVGGSDE